MAASCTQDSIKNKSITRSENQNTRRNTQDQKIRTPEESHDQTIKAPEEDGFSKDRPVRNARSAGHSWSERLFLEDPREQTAGSASSSRGLSGGNGALAGALRGVRRISAAVRAVRRRRPRADCPAAWAGYCSADVFFFFFVWAEQRRSGFF